MSACTISYKFTGTSIDYNIIKTIQLDDLPNRASYVWAPMASMLNEAIKDKYSNQTRLELVKKDGDLHISGEITAYDQYNKGVSSDGYSQQVQLRMTVNIRYENKPSEENWERSFTANASYNSTQQLSAVQEELVEEMIEDIVDQIFNATVAQW